MTAADIIARALCEWSGSGQGVDDMLAEISAAQSAAILSAISASGYRILAPDELDPKTIEACAKVSEADADEWVGQNGGAACIAIAAAIRALAKQEAKE